LKIGGTVQRQRSKEVIVAKKIAFSKIGIRTMTDETDTPPFNKQDCSASFGRFVCAADTSSQKARAASDFNRRI
jgi:hypothetical protein